MRSNNDCIQHLKHLELFISGISESLKNKLHIAGTNYLFDLFITEI